MNPDCLFSDRSFLNVPLPNQVRRDPYDSNTLRALKCRGGTHAAEQLPLHRCA